METCGYTSNKWMAPLSWDVPGGIPDLMGELPLPFFPYFFWQLKPTTGSCSLIKKEPQKFQENSNKKRLMFPEGLWFAYDSLGGPRGFMTWWSCWTKNTVDLWTRQCSQVGLGHCSDEFNHTFIESNVWSLFFAWKRFLWLERLAQS